MSTAAAAFATHVSPKERLAVLFDELAELTGQRNAIDGRIVDIVAEIDRDGLAGMTGVKSVEHLVAWKTGVTPRNAETLAAVARRADEFPRCTQALRDGVLSLDRIGVIAERAADGSDAHYAPLAVAATVTQLRTAVKLEPRPKPDPEPEPGASITKHVDGEYTTWRIRLPRVEAAKFDAALASHRDKLVTDWKHDDDTDAEPGDAAPEGGAQTPATGDAAPAGRPPMPTTMDAFLSLVDAGWDADALRRPHGQQTTIVVHVDVDKPVAALHLGPLLSDADRRYLSCDATCEVWFERHGQPIGAGRTTRTISRRLRRALEHRDRTCVVPGCGATRGLHAHHLQHWEDGGPTELHNLVMVCPFHHRAHHRGEIILIGPADQLVVTDADGHPMTNRALAKPPTTPPPAVPPCPGPTGERAQWWWYNPYQPQPPPSPN